MNTLALQHFRRKLQADEAVYGLWVTLESPSITEIGVGLGLDWIVIDAEHGHLDWGDIVNHVRAAVRSRTIVLVRVAEVAAGLIKRALDIGADGVVVPWIETAQQLQEAVELAHYPQRGKRGIGAERATCWGEAFVQHVAEAEEHVLVVPILESVPAGNNVEQLCAIEGVDVMFFGPADYSATAGYAGQWEGPGVAEMILIAKDAIRKAGKHCGLIATSNENLSERHQQGFRMLGLGLDSGLMLRSLHEALKTVDRDRKLDTSLSPDKA